METFEESVLLAICCLLYLYGTVTSCQSFPKLERILLLLQMILLSLSCVFSTCSIFPSRFQTIVIYTFTVCVNMKWRFSFVYSFQYDKCLEACRSAAIKLFDFFRLSVERKLSKVWYVICYENFDSDFQSQKLVTICIFEWLVILNYLAKFIITVTASWKSKISDILKNNCKTLPRKVTIEFS